MEIVIERLLHCHPIIYTLLAKIFNLMLKIGHVPTEFGQEILIPLPKSDKTNANHKIESFRGITLSIVISQVFEHCLMELFFDYLCTDDNQFGFKSKIGCLHAIYTIRHAVDYFVQNDSTVNLCLIDVSKAFDRLNHYTLFLKLMKRQVPVVFIKILQNWYENVVLFVKWNNTELSAFQVTAEVRQGGISFTRIIFSIC